MCCDLAPEFVVVSDVDSTFGLTLPFRWGYEAFRGCFGLGGVGNVVVAFYFVPILAMRSGPL